MPRLQIRPAQILLETPRADGQTLVSIHTQAVERSEDGMQVIAVRQDLFAQGGAPRLLTVFDPFQGAEVTLSVAAIAGLVERLALEMIMEEHGGVLEADRVYLEE